MALGGRNGDGRRRGGRVIEVNLIDTPMTATAAIALRGPASEIVPVILAVG